MFCFWSWRGKGSVGLATSLQWHDCAPASRRISEWHALFTLRVWPGIELSATRALNAAARCSSVLFIYLAICLWHQTKCLTCFTGGISSQVSLGMDSLNEAARNNNTASKIDSTIRKIIADSLNDGCHISASFAVCRNPTAFVFVYGAVTQQIKLRCSILSLKLVCLGGISKFGIAAIRFPIVALVVSGAVILALKLRVIHTQRLSNLLIHIVWIA